MEHICIIGGGGFIGYHLVSKMLSLDLKITIIDKFPNPELIKYDKLSYLVHDYSDSDYLLHNLKNVDAIINLAYSTVPKTSYEDPVKDIYENLAANIKLFEVVNLLGIPKLIDISSGGTVYGNPEFLPITEKHPTNPISPYGISKLASEKYGLMYYKLKNLPIIILRPANAYGEFQKPYTGQGFIATAIASILENKSITLYGGEDIIRDYIHVDDIADAILSVLEKGKTGEIYNVGTGTGISNTDIINHIISASGIFLPKNLLNIMEKRSFDVEKNILDFSKLKNATGWLPKIPFVEGIKKAWEWFKNFYTY